MKTISVKIFTALILMFSSMGIAASSAVVGQPAPDFVLRSTDGSNLRLSEYRSEVVVLSFWAPWCGKCRDSMG
jgi:thiol-disulfide isomerase/thioredoxin